MSDSKVYRKDVIKALSWIKGYGCRFKSVTGEMLYYMMFGALSEVKDVEPSDSEKWHDITKKPCKMPLPGQEVIVKDTCGDTYLLQYKIDGNYWIDDEAKEFTGRVIKWHMIPEE